ncbi:hypothetical protein [Klebsiella quasipneumoniae]|uniref:Uncharacterized protein n=1 Tax=Klebsiella quasipneumoniae TaxID=1463165 RepID=A0A8H9ZYA0_9ENTR|nr:hypothetical protein [Klebsiella quasipneumoniae]MBC4643869.1 hypothetical protein [Klebsiella quasipneumoniae]MBC4694823.1 hypothetical protein [Klebsiella quasipneumoniae]MBC4722100.1 hypothetical protein [Klebsiella quasipneumoniae]MBC5047611.1 hypothetical protein [Klebsiella quasipneumoniae]MDL4001648.1 hypothetical protein [Klebsiella quasipneumoniae]
MTEIAQCPAVKQINFYILEASPELLVDRRVYLEVVLLKIWRSRLETIRSWNCVSDEDRILAEAYQRGIDFLTKTVRLVTRD